MEVDDLLPIVEAAAMLGFATAREGDVDHYPARQGIRGSRY